MSSIDYIITRFQNALPLFIILIVIGVALTWWLPKLIKKYDKKQAGKVIWHHALFLSISSPAIIFYWFLLTSLIIQYSIYIYNLHFFSSYLSVLRSIVLLLIIFWFLMRMLAQYERIATEAILSGKVEYNRTTLRAFMQVARVILIVCILLVLLQTINIKLSALLTVGGVGAIAISYAAKDIFLANFIGGMMIFIDRPFSVGDWIRSPDRDIEGTVENIGWRLTLIRTFDKRPLYVPNAVFSTISLENPSRMTNRRIKANIGLRYDDFKIVAPIVSAIEKMLHKHQEIDQQQLIMVYFNEFGDSSLDFMVYCFTKTTNWQKYLDVQQDVFLQILQIIEENGAECAFPTSTLHVPEAVSMINRNEEK
jgi:MscS family membrane protein